MIPRKKWITEFNKNFKRTQNISTKISVIKDNDAFKG